ncbi:stage II sporulation protein M [Paenibacillus thalictri]|uniref:Stage II sporulation protein M n=1 Tax=Paenibacillus thalictri TaxID=2527873 RepID=A0A4Q9DF92_9BACL|nr:stage II sporulation protein M [Paenibacillus thalictri]TBL69226.1 stage II sporulation protein M [Paenibacillus thalictri]
MTWRHMVTQLGRMKHYIIASCAVFFVGLVLGFGFSGSYQHFIEMQMKALQELAKSAASKSHPQMSLFWLIFWNNVSTSFKIIGLGVFFGVLPLFFLLANGLLLGYVASDQASKQSVMLFIKGILPHGVIEIPAIILAAALGIRLGALVLKSFFRFFNPAKDQRTEKELRPFIASLVPFGLLLVVALFVAAVIESTITYWLVKM